MAFSRSKDSNNFNFLRLLFAVLVLLSHAPELIDGDRHREILTMLFHTISFGELAVYGFFLLSGYLIVQSWQRTPQLLFFLKKRILRIYPGFIVASLVCAFVVGPLGASSPSYLAQLDLFQLFKSTLFLLLPAVPPVFMDQPHPFVNGALWTIGYEFRCYLLVALFGILGIINRRKLWLIFSVFVLGLSLVVSVFPNFADEIHIPGLKFLLSNPSDFIRLLTYFCAGGCFYLFREKIHYKQVWVLMAFSLTILSLFEAHALQLVLPTLGAYLFFGFSFLSLPALQQIMPSADISYGVYLYGWPTQKLLYWYFPLISPWLAFVLTCGICVVCGYLSWYLVEKPSLALKRTQQQVQYMAP
jgi:peptidoglycan/LPS O-acetylase OafA/YrhL